MVNLLFEYKLNKTSPDQRRRIWLKSAPMGSCQMTKALAKEARKEKEVEKEVGKERRGRVEAEEERLVD